MLVLLQWGRGRACIFMVINTCTQSFNLPYLSHVTVWLHCLIWVSFNLSHPRLEINEGRKRHIWVSYSVEEQKGWDELETNVIHLTVLSLFFFCFSLIPFLCLSLALSLTLSLSSCLAARCSPFFHCSPPNRRSARGPFGVRHLCSVIQSATALFIPDLFGALESLSLIHAKIRHFFFLFFPLIHHLPIQFLNTNVVAVWLHWWQQFLFGGGGGVLIWFILICFLSTGQEHDTDHWQACQEPCRGCFVTVHLCVYLNSWREAFKKRMA